MAAPKPITITYIPVAEAASSGIPGADKPQPFAVIGEPAGGTSDPIAIADVTGLQAALADLQDRLTVAEGKIAALEAGGGAA